MTQNCVIHREIGIDVGHRVPDHGSKCRNPHGHRYRVIATCRGPVTDQTGNEENGMVADFGHVKTFLMDLVDSVFDHAFVVYRGDTAMMQSFFRGQDHTRAADLFQVAWNNALTVYYKDLKEQGIGAPGLILPRTLISEQDPDGMKVVVVNYVPTAENLAKHMFEMVAKAIDLAYNNPRIVFAGKEEGHVKRNDGVLELVNLRLYETPNGWVDYPGGEYVDVQ